MIKLHILDAGKTFSPSKILTIRKAYNRAVKTCSKLISVSDVDVIIYHNPTYVMPETGIGGSTPTFHLIDIPVDAKRKLDPEVLYLTICHEMHHAMRQRKFGFPKTLFDTVISEGLADQFEKEINPDKELITHKKDLNKKVILNGFNDLKKELNSKNYNYFGWFFGEGAYPKYFGYTLGNIIVKAYLDKNKTRPSKLVNKTTNSFTKYIEVAKESL